MIEKCIKIGRASFNTEAVRSMTFKDFESIHKHLPIDLKKAYEACGGVVEKPKKPRKTSDD